MSLLATIKRWLTPVQTPLHPVLPYEYDLDAELIRFNEWGDSIRLRDASEGILIMGATGSGKSSGPGKEVAHSLLRAGAGGLVLCAKPGEARQWLAWIEQIGRSSDVIHIRPGSGRFKFNFINYEINRPDGGGRETYNLVALIELVMDTSAQALGHVSQGEGAAFWIGARRELLANAIDPLVAATGHFRLEDLMAMVTSAPRTVEEAFSDQWKQKSFCYKILQKAVVEPLGRPMSVAALNATADFWFSTFAKLDERTRSNIVATLTSAISPFLRGVLNETFCGETTVIPELTHEGAIIILDFPVKEWGAAGAVAGQIFKYQWQKAVERRFVDFYTRPCFLYVDECQTFLSKYDDEFQSTARSSRAITVYITQNLPTFYAQTPARDPKSAAHSLLGNFQTKIFLTNTDPETNRYASDLIGKSLQRRASQNWSVNEGQSANEGYSTNWGVQAGRSGGTNWGQNSSYGSSSGTGGQSSSTSSSGSSKGGQKGWSRSHSSGAGTSSGTGWSQGSSDGGGWSEQMDDTVPPAAFASSLRKGGQSDSWLVDAVVVQGGRRFAISNSHWLHCTFHQ